MLLLISSLHSRLAFSFMQDHTKVIMQVFATIELYGGDMTSCCWETSGFGSGSCSSSFDRKRKPIWVRGERTPIYFSKTIHRFRPENLGYGYYLPLQMYTITFESKICFALCDLVPNFFITANSCLRMRHPIFLSSLN